MVRKYLLFSLKSLCILLVSAAVGFALLLAAYLLPTEPIQRHIEKSADTIMDEWDYPFVHAWGHMWRDNYTDYLMINHAGYGGGEPLVEKALNVYSVTARHDGEDLLPSARLLVGYTDFFDLEAEGITLGRSAYARYWHGYLIFLKPLFSLFSYGQIRVVNTVVQILLLLLALFLMWKREAKRLIAPFVLVWAVLIPKDTAALFQYSDMFYLYVIGSIVVLAFYEKFKGTNALGYTFLLLGIATSYFDYLTYPLVSLAIPLCVCLFLSRYATVKAGVKQIVLLSAMWAVGYAGMWACKWLLVSLFTSGSTMGIVSDKLKAWTSQTSDLGDHITFFDTVSRTFGCILPNPAFWACAAYTVVLAIVSAVKKTYRRENLVFFGLLALYPFLWFAVISSHSYSHYWFTHKELVVFLFALMLLVTGNQPLPKKAAAEKSGGGKGGGQKSESAPKTAQAGKGNPNSLTALKKGSAKNAPAQKSSSSKRSK